MAIRTPEQKLNLSTELYTILSTVKTPLHCTILGCLRQRKCGKKSSIFNLQVYKAFSDQRQPEAKC